MTFVLVPGGGKTTQVKILAGDLEPTAGEVIKSSKELRVAFLRQEFVDELVMERSLKDELISVFTEEADILAALQRCEVRKIHRPQAFIHTTRRILENMAMK